MKKKQKWYERGDKKKESNVKIVKERKKKERKIDKILKKKWIKEIKMITDKEMKESIEWKRKILVKKIWQQKIYCRRGKNEWKI